MHRNILANIQSLEGSIFLLATRVSAAMCATYPSRLFGRETSLCIYISGIWLRNMETIVLEFLLKGNLVNEGYQKNMGRSYEQVASGSEFSWRHFI